MGDDAVTASHLSALARITELKENYVKLIFCYFTSSYYFGPVTDFSFGI